MPSFDISSEVDHQEVTNAMDQAAREVSTRFDFRDTNSAAELGDRRLGVGVPSGLLRVLDWVRWLVWWSPTPPSLVRLVGADLVVDSTALGLTGWSATHTSAEAFLVAHAPAWWPSLSARRRQDLVLGGAASVLLAGLGGAGWGIARRWR